MLLQEDMLKLKLFFHCLKKDDTLDNNVISQRALRNILYDHAMKIYILVARAFMIYINVDIYIATLYGSGGFRKIS